MWDVKVSGWTQKAFFETGFTLTMWDVKVETLLYFLQYLFCFTLTMWDVKLSKVEDVYKIF